MYYLFGRSKKRDGDGGLTSESEPLKTERIVFAAMQIGLTVADFEHMTIGMIFDQIITYNNIMSEQQEGVGEYRRAATIEEMEAF